MKRAILNLIATAAIGVGASSHAAEFDLKDPKGVNNIVFLSDAPLESINGTATGITGTVNYDPENPAETTGAITVAVASMSVANPKMQEHLLSDKWMNESKHPEITFELEKLSDVDAMGTTSKGTAHGVMTIKGVSKEMAIPVSLTYLEGKMKDRQGKPGDILVIRSTFTVSRSDFKLNAASMEDKVSDEVELRLSIAGFNPADS